MWFSADIWMEISHATFHHPSYPSFIHINVIHDIPGGTIEEIGPETWLTNKILRRFNDVRWWKVYFMKRFKDRELAWIAR
jgi:hypothetical protein